MPATRSTTTDLHAIERILRLRTGRDQAISAPVLSELTGIPERTIRRLISTSPHLQPCARPGGGYYWPADIDEIHRHDNCLTQQTTALRRRQRLFRAFWHRQGIAFPKS